MRARTPTLSILATQCLDFVTEWDAFVGRRGMRGMAQKCACFYKCKSFAVTQASIASLADDGGEVSALKTQDLTPLLLLSL